MVRSCKNLKYCKGITGIPYSYLSVFHFSDGRIGLTIQWFSQGAPAKKIIMTLVWLLSLQPHDNNRINAERPAKRQHTSDEAADDQDYACNRERNCIRGFHVVK